MNCHLPLQKKVLNPEEGPQIGTIETLKTSCLNLRATRLKKITNYLLAMTHPTESRQPGETNS